MYDTCPICGRLKKIFNTPCSISCGAKRARKFIWDYDELYDLIINKNIPLVQIARIKGVSDTTIKKVAIKMKII